MGYGALQRQPKLDLLPFGGGWTKLEPFGKYRSEAATTMES